MEQRHQFFHLVVCILLISTQVSSQWLSRRTPARIPGRGFHMSRPRIRPPPFPPGHPYYRHPQNLPPHQHPMLPVQTTLLPPNGPNSTVITTLSPNSSALNYIEITSEDPSMKTTTTTTTTTVRTVNKNAESADAKATVSTSVVSSGDTSTSTAGVDGDDGVVPTPTDTSQSNVNTNDPNTVFSDRMIELLKKLGELAAEENSTSASTSDKKSDRLIEVDLDPPDDPNPTVDNPNAYNPNDNQQNQNANSATTESTGPEPDYSALFGSLPAPTEEPQPVSLSQSLPPPPFPPPPQPHPPHPPHPSHHPFHNKNRRMPPKHPMRGPPPPHRPPPPKARPPPPPKARHPPHPHPPHPHPPPHHPPPQPHQPHNTMWNKVRGILPFSRKRVVPPPHPHHAKPEPEHDKDASSTTVKSSTSEPENPARRLDDNISEDLNAREKKTDQAKGKSGSSDSDPEVKISDFSLEFVKDSKLPQRRIDKLSHLPPPPPPKISSRSDEVSSSRSYLNSNSNTMNTLAKLSPKKPIMVFMRAEGIYEIHRTGQDPGKIVKKFAGSTKIQFFNGTLPKENIPPVFLAPEDSDAPLGYGKIPIPKISSKSDPVDLDALPLPKPQPTYLSIPAQLELLRKQRDRLKLLKHEEENRKLDAKDQSKYYTPKDTQSQKSVPEADFKFVGFDDDEDRFTGTGPSSNTRGHNPLAAALAGGYEIELPSGSDSNGLSSSVLKTIVGSLINSGAPPSTIRDISSGNYELNPPKLKAHPAPAPIPVIGNPINSHYSGAQRVESHYNGQFIPPGPGPAPGPEPVPVPVPAPAGGRYPPFPKPHDYSSHETFPRRNSDHPHPGGGDDGFDNGHGSDSREEPPPPPKDGISFNMQFYVKKDKPRRPPPPPHGRGSKRPPGPHYGPPPTPKGPTEPSPQYGVPPPLKNPSPIKPFLHGHYGKPFSQEAEEHGGSSGERQQNHQHHDSSIQHHSVVPPPANFNQQNMQNYLRNNQPSSNQQNNSPNNQQQRQQNSFPQNQFPQNQNQNQNTQQNQNQNQNQNSQHNGPNHHNHHQQQNNGNIFHSQQNSTQNFMVVPGYSNEYNDNAMKSPNMYVPYHHHRQQNHQHQDQHQNQHQNHHQSSPTYHPPPPLHRPNTNQIYVTESKEERPPGLRPLKSQSSQNSNQHMSFFGYESGLGPKETQYNSIEKLNGMSTPDLDLSESTPHHSYKKTSSRHRHRNPGSKESGERSSGSGQGSKELYIVHSSKAKRRKNQQTKSKSPTVIIAGSGGNLSHLDKIINSLNLGKDKSEEGQGQGQESEEQVPVHHFHHYAKAQSHERKTSHKNAKPPATHFTGNIVQSAVVQNLDGLFKSVSGENTNSRPQTIILQSSNQNPISGEQQTITISNLNSNSQQVDPNGPVEFSFGDIAELMQQQQAQSSSSAQQQDLQQQQQQQPQSIFIHPSFTQQQQPQQQQPQIIIQQLPPQPVQPQIILQTQLPGHNNQPQIFFQQDSSQQQQQQQQPLPQIFIHPGQNIFQQQIQQQQQQQQQQPLQLGLPQGQILHANNSAPGAPLPQVIFFPPGQQPGNLIQQQQQPQQPQLVHQEPQQHHVQVQQLMQQQLSQQQQQLQLPPLAFNSPVMSATPGPFVPFVTPLSHLFPGHGHGQVQGHGQGHGQVPFGGPTHHTVVSRQSPSPAVPTMTMTMESFSTIKPPISDDSLEPVLEKLRKEEKIVWKQLPGAGAEPGRMVPLRITTQEKQYLHPNGNTEVESTVVDTSIAEDLIGTNPMESIEFFKRSGSGSGSGENPTAVTTQETVHEGGGQKEHHPKSVFTGLLQAKAEMEKMKQDLHFEQKSSFKNGNGQKRDSNSSSSSRNSSIFGK